MSEQRSVQSRGAAAHRIPRCVGPFDRAPITHGAPTSGSESTAKAVWDQEAPTR